MKRFDDVIKGMTDNQKIGFICSSSFEKEKIEGTNAYTISFYTEEVSDNGSLYQLAISLNDSLIENYLLSLKKNLKEVHIGSLLDKTNERVNTISSSKYINDHILSVYYESLKKACTKTAILIPYSDDDIDRIDTLYHEFYVVTHSYPDYLICNNYLDKSKISTYNFTNEMIINCEDLKTIVKAINNGYF